MIYVTNVVPYFCVTAPVYESDSQVAEYDAGMSIKLHLLLISRSFDYFYSNDILLFPFD